MVDHHCPVFLFCIALAIVVVLLSIGRVTTDAPVGAPSIVPTSVPAWTPTIPGGGGVANDDVFSPPLSEDDDRNSFSIGALAGISIGSTAAVCALLFAVWTIFKQALAFNLFSRTHFILSNETTEYLHFVVIPMECTTGFKVLEDEFKLSEFELSTKVDQVKAAFQSAVRSTSVPPQNIGSIMRSKNERLFLFVVSTKPKGLGKEVLSIWRTLIVIPGIA